MSEVDRYKLRFAQKPFSFDEKLTIYRSGLRGRSPLQLYAVQSGGLDLYRFNNDSWIKELSMTNLTVRQLYFDVSSNMLIAKTEEDISFYQQNDNEFNLLCRSKDFEEDIFNDVYFGWNEPGSVLKFGHFYHELNLLGILTHRREHGIELFAVMNESLENREYPISRLETNLSILGNCSRAEFALSDLKHNGQENIIVHGHNGLNVYWLNQENELEHLLQVPNSAKPDDSEVKLFFPNLTGQFYRDIVLLNSSGLFLYQYSDKKSNYGLIDYQPLFAKLKGWRQEHTVSVKFEDIDLDGRQEMLFTGPKGINLLSFNNNTNQWKSLLDNAQLTISERHCAVLEVLPAQSPMVFTKCKNKVLWASIVEAPEVLKVEFKPSDRNSDTPFTKLQSPVMPTFNFEEKIYTMLLREQLDCTSIIGAVDSSTGRPKFRLPLVDLSSSASDLRFDLFYDGSSQVSDSLGVGWSLPKNFITMDDQSSVFLEDAIYYIILQDMPLQLTFDSRNSTDNVFSYNISNGPSDSRIYYHKNKEMWELDTDGVRQIYGRTLDNGNDSIGWALKWKNWRGVGSSTTGQEQFANAWYLSEVKDKYDNVLRWTYDAVTVSVPGGKSFTREISLKTISDNHGNKIIFNYSAKEKSEYDSPDLVDKKGNFNTQMVQSRYLGGYSVTTPSYQQVINFIYEVRDGKRFLMQIAQKADISNQPILKISYKELSKSFILESVLLPTGVSVQFDFKLLGEVSSINEERGQRYVVGENHRVDYGVDYVLVSYIARQWQVVLRIFNQDMTKELYSSLSWENSSNLPLLGKSITKSYGVFLAESFIAVVIHYTADQDLYLLRIEDDKWLKTSYTFGAIENIQFGKDFMVVEDNNSAIEVISWNKDSKKWIMDRPFVQSSTNKGTILHKTFGRGLFFYDDNQLSIRYKDSEDLWKYKKITVVPGVIKDIKETLDKFALGEQLQNDIFKLFKNTALQISGNLLLLNRWKSEGMKLYSVMDLYVLDSSYQVAKHKQHKILQDDLNEFSEWVTYTTGTSLKATFEIDKGKFRVIFEDLRGTALDDIHKNIADCDQRIKHRNKILEECTLNYNKNPSHKLFLLNRQKYLAVLSSQVVVYNNKTLIFTGDGWKEDTTAFETDSKHDKLLKQLGEKFVLRQENLNSSIKLYAQSNEGEMLVLDLEVKQINQTLVRWPIYLAHQQTGSQVSVIDFENKECIGSTYKLPLGEKLNPFSSYETIVTSIDNFNEYSSTLVFRQQLSVRRLLPNPVATKVTVTFDDGTKRVTGYDYGQSKASGNAVYYKHISIVPGNDKRSFGWVEEFKDLGNRSNAEKKIFNSKGVLIKTLKFDEEQSEEGANRYTNTTIFDITGRLEVVNSFPIKIADQEVGYYGFEGYELNRIGERNYAFEKKWVYDEKDIVKDGFSFTGSNFLRLAGKALMGAFKPADQTQQYLVSCWMRPQSTVFDLGVYLKAVVSATHTSKTYVPLGEVKFQLNNWYYLEVIVDLLYAKHILNYLKKSQTNKTQGEMTDITISVVIDPGMNTTIDIDHVRFSALSNQFKVNVYDSRTRQVKEVIRANGLIERRIYDNYQKQIAVIDENGKLKEFSTYTKASSIGRMTTLKSKVVIQTENGFYEDFAPYSFHNRWRIDSADVWQNSKGQLQHLTNDSHTLQLNWNDISHTSYGMRLNFSLQSDGAVINFNKKLKAIRSGNTAKIVFSGKGQSVPLDGELLIVFEGGRVFVWVDGGLYIDGACNSSLFNIEISGRTKIGDLVVFSRPSVQVTYLNAVNEIVQEIILEAENTAIVTQILYDELGRKTVTTQPARVKRSSSQSVLAYYPKFVTNSNPDAKNSVWKTGKLQGEAIGVIDEYDYSQVKYCDYPLKEECTVGLPGKEFSVSGPFAKRFSYSTNNLFIENNFPSNQNYTYRVEHKPGNVEEISVFDTMDQRMAWYVSVQGRKDLLSTYEYDENGKLLMSLSPLYYEKAGTFYKQYAQLHATSSVEKILQDSLGVNISYDRKGNIITKTTPDSGKVENVYDENGLLNFILYYMGSKIDNIVYFDYDELGRLSSTGQVDSSTPKEELLTLTLSGNNSKVYQKFHYSDSERHPLLRGLTARTITYNGEEPLIEESILNIDEKFVSKRVIIPTEDSEKPVLIEVNKEYVGGRLREIEYPIDVQGGTLSLSYQYDKLGQITGVGVAGKENLFASYTYNANGQVSSEVHLPDSAKNFTRQFGYNSAEFLISLKDNFLSEKVYYTEAGYGGYGYGDGTITRTEFEATWHDLSDNSKFGLHERSFVNRDTTSEESATCFHALKKAGYINDRGHQAKIFYSALEHGLPIICSYGVIGRHIQSTLGKEGFPAQYGHSYDYGNFQELTKAKYFVGREVPAPLQPDSFAKEIRGINKKSSRDIFERLGNSKYMIRENEKSDASLAHSKSTHSFIRPSLSSDLKNVNVDYERFRLPLERLLIKCFSQNLDLASLKLIVKDALTSWRRNQEAARKSAIEILKMLDRNGYLKNPLAKEFSDLLTGYQPFIPDIVRVLSEHFANNLGEAEFDVESYSIDANGNHKHFYTGFDRYEISYHNNTNQVSSVHFKSFASSREGQQFLIKHDSRGNVIQAMHKGIERIDYHPVSNRATKIQLTDGRTLTFNYDAQGERVLKRVSDSTGQTTKEIHYVRDESGRTLVEREITYIAGGLRSDVSATAYIYGPRGLIGFIREHSFYSVITDHEGSIRLVVKGDEVVAAYDYLPYGNFMREYRSDPNGQISYRFTGQEWDEEIGLYNFHARFYDPSIGRFYQFDPKEQYFSPYKYAGNSPISMIDPNGEFAFIIPVIIGSTLLGAYLGGAAANKNWDLTKWNYTSGATWMGIMGGGLAGALAPLGFGASVAAISGSVGFYSAIAITTGIGLGVSYLSVASLHGWNPAEWDLESPETWNAAFLGFTMGASLIGGGAGYNLVMNRLSFVGKSLLVVGTVTVFGGSFVTTGIKNKWDFSKPSMYFGIFQAVDDSINLPLFLRSVSKSGLRSFKDVARAIRGGRHMFALNSVGKMVLKGGLGVSLPILVQAGLNEGLNMSDPSTYFDLVRQMGMVNQVWMMQKPIITKIKARRELIKIKKQIKLSKNIAAADIKIRARIAKENARNEARIAIEDASKKAGQAKEDARREAIIAKEDAFGDDGILEAYRKQSAKRAESVAMEKAKTARATAKKRTEISRATAKERAELARLDARIELELALVGRNEADKIVELDAKGKTEVADAMEKAEIARADAKEKADIARADAREELEIAIDGRKQADEITKAYMKEKAQKEKADATEREEIKKADAKEREEIKKGRINFGLTIRVKRFKLTDDSKIASKGKVLETTYKKRKTSEAGKVTDKQVNSYEVFLNPDPAVNDKIIREIEINKKIISRNNREVLFGSASQLTQIIKDLDQTAKIRETEHVTREAIEFPVVRLPTWELNKCAESHGITILSGANDIFGIKTQKSERYLATYTTKGLKDFPAYRQCKSTTIKNIVTEPWWKDMIDAFKERASDFMLDISKNHSHFLMPMTNMSLKAEDSSPNKQKRSIFGEQSQVETTSNPATGAGKGKFILMQSGKHSFIDSNKEATSSATRSSAFVNNWFRWAVKRAESVKYFINGWLPDNINDFKSANGENNMEFMGITDIDANGTILLLDTLIRRATGQKHIASNVRRIAEQDAYCYAIKIIEGFEKIIEQTAEITQISTIGSNIEFPKVQGEVIKRILSGKYCEIVGVLNACAQKAFHGSDDVGLSLERFNKFMNILDKKLGILLNQAIPRILTGKDNILEIKEQHNHLENIRDFNNVSVLCHTATVKGLI